MTTPRYIEKQADPVDIKLDPLNPRLHGDHRQDSQQDLLAALISKFRVEEVVASIASTGYVPHDILAGYEDKGGVVVREGNRRIAALKVLKDPAIDPKRQQKWDEFRRRMRQDSVASLATVTIRVYPRFDHPELESYIGFRHVNGVQQWPPEEKARFIVDLVERQKWSYADIASRIGSYPKHVERHYIAYSVIRQARDAEIDGADEMTIGIMLRALQAPGIKDFLSVTFPGDPEASYAPVPESNIADFTDFVRWTFGTAKHEPVLDDSRHLTEWGKILQAEQAVRYLRNTKRPRFERAWFKAGGEQETVLDALLAAADRLEEAIPNAGLYRQDDEITDAIERVSRLSYLLIRDFPDIVKRRKSEICND